MCTDVHVHLCLIRLLYKAVVHYFYYLYITVIIIIIIITGIIVIMCSLSVYQYMPLR